MTFPFNPVFYGVEIKIHLVAEVLAFSVGFRYYTIQRRKLGTTDNFTSEQRLIIILAATIGALIFSRVIAALENLQEWLEADNKWLYLYSVKTIAGGFIGGWLFVEIVKHFMKVKASSGDVMVYPIILGTIIGRLGCFSQGVKDMTHGLPTTFYTGMDLGDGQIRHPLAIYEIFILISIGILIHIINKRYPFTDGWKFKSFMLLYLLYRFIAEYMKPHFPLIFGLTSIQIAVIFTYILNINSICKLIKNNVR